MDIELFTKHFNTFERKRKRIQRLIYYAAIVCFALGTALIAVGFFKNYVGSTSTFASFLSLGIAYAAIGVSFYSTWANIDVAEDTDVITLNAILLLFEETQAKIDENNKLVQELLTELRMKDE